MSNSIRLKVAIVFIIGIVQAFFIEFLLLGKKNKSLTDKILAMWMFVIGLHLFLHYLFYVEYYNTFPFFMGVMQPLPLIHGPFLLLYIQFLISDRPAFEKKHWLHFIPVAVFYVVIFPDAFLRSSAELMEFAFETLETDPPLYWMFFEVLINLSGVVYVVWSLIILRKHKKNIKNNFSYTEKINLDWLVVLIAGMAVIWVVVLLSTETGDYIFVAVTGFIFAIGYFGSRQVAIFSNPISADTKKASPSKEKYEKSTLTEAKSQEHLESLQSLMSGEKPYLESKVTLKEISDRMEIHPNHLSQVINEKLNQNFFDFINSHRVGEFKERLAGDTAKKFTLLAHAYDSGFSSKSSFNEVFKKFTGLTPSQYQKNLSD